MQQRLSIVIQDRADAAVLGEQRIAAEAEQVEVEGLAGFFLAVALNLDDDGLDRFSRGEGQCAGLGDVVVVARCRRAVQAVADHRDRERRAGLAGRDGHVTGRVDVVVASRGSGVRAVVRRLVVDRQINVGGVPGGSSERSRGPLQLGVRRSSRNSMRSRYIVARGVALCRRGQWPRPVVKADAGSAANGGMTWSVLPFSKLVCDTMA